MGVPPGRWQALPARQHVLCTAAALVGMACSGCAGPAPQAGLRQAQTRGSCTATLVIRPYPPLTMQKTILGLQLTDDGGRPISGAEVSYDLTMPDCVAMPVNRPRAAERPEGAYEATAIFTMAGYWQARVQVSEAGDDQEFIFFLKVK